MKKLILILLVLLVISCQAQKSKDMDYIKFEHVGESDKPIRTLILATAEIAVFKENLIVDFEVVSEDSFQLMNKYISDKVDDFQSFRESKFEYGSFKIVSVYESITTEYVLQSSDESQLYFRTLIELFENQNKEDKALKALESILIRLN
ncbi:hypothetical protein [Ekhidna sp. To15]|uniref:hypothetical protein n=1 Tax=Ekhidna sp. To15 TaxID=3395267 RepID=UPI003F524E00